MGYIGIDAKKDIRLNATSDLDLTSDSTTIKFGADDDVILTHVHNTGLTLNSTNKMMFNDASQFIQGSSATVLSLGATDEIDLTATTIDMNGAVDISGNATIGGSTVTDSNMLNIQGDASSVNVGAVFNKTNSTAQIWSTQVRNSDNAFLIHNYTANSTPLIISTAGNVGIGASPSTTFHVSGDNPRARFTDTPNSVNFDIFMGDDNATVGMQTNHSLILMTNDAERAKINNSGTLLVGKTAANFATAGTEINSSGRVFITYDGGGPLQLNRKTSHGDIIELHKDGVEHGSIGSGTGELVISTPSGIQYISQKLTGDSDGLQYSNSGSYHLGPWLSKDNAVNLGRSGGRWKDLYLSGGAYIGGTGSANYLDDYEEGTWTPVYQMTGTAFSSITHDVQIGTYTKVGRLVTVNFGIRTSALTKGSASGDVTIAGLPFANNSATAVGPVVHAAQDGWITTVPNAGWARSDSTIYLSYIIGGTSTTYGGITINNMSTGSAKNRTYGSATYET